MKNRRDFFKAVAAPAAAFAAGGVALGASEDNPEQFIGSWHEIHSLPIPPFFFHEYLSIEAGGTVHETNSFLHTASNLDFSFYPGMPSVLNAGDGFGNWERASNRSIRVVFRKLLFDGQKNNFADLRAYGIVTLVNGRMVGTEWTIEAIDPFTDKRIVLLGYASTDAVKITLAGQTLK